MLRIAPRHYFHPNEGRGVAAELAVTALLMLGVGLGIGAFVTFVLLVAAPGRTSVSPSAPIALTIGATVCFVAYRLVAHRVWQRRAAPGSRPFPGVVDGKHASITLADDALLVVRMSPQWRLPLLIAGSGYALLVIAHAYLGIAFFDVIALPFYLSLPFGWKRETTPVPYLSIASFAPVPESNNRFVVHRRDDSDAPVELQLKGFSRERFVKEMSARLGVGPDEAVAELLLPPPLPSAGGALGPVARIVSGIVPWARRADSAGLVALGGCTLVSTLR